MKASKDIFIQAFRFDATDVVEMAEKLVFNLNMS